MRISTNEFLLGSLNDMLAQQSTVNQLNREIATGQTMLDASSDPGGAAQMVGVTSQIAHLTYDSANGAAATQTLQSGVGALQQVTNFWCSCGRARWPPQPAPRTRRTANR